MVLAPRPLFAAFALAIVLSPLPAAADPPSWSGAWQLHERYHRPDDSDDGGPVPLATLGAAPDIAVARGLPYGFNRGTCDHGLLEAATGAALPVGGAVGRLMGHGDRECLWGALESLPDDRAIAWMGENGTLFRVSVQRTYMSGGARCRDWAAKAAVPAGNTQSSGTFCRRSDGQWAAAR